MKLVTIDLEKIQQEIHNYDKHIVWLEDSLNKAATAAKRIYLAELKQEQQALKLLVGFVDKFKHQNPFDEPIAKLPVVEVITLGSDSGNKYVIDKAGNQYYIKSRKDSKFDIINSEGNLVNFDLKIVTEFSK